MAKVNQISEGKRKALEDIFSALGVLLAAFGRYDERNKVKHEVFYTAASAKAIDEAISGITKAALDIQWRAVVHDQDALKVSRTDTAFQRFLQSQCLETGTPENGGAA